MESEFRILCKRRKLRVNGNKSKVISFNRVQGQVSRDMTFRYLRVDMAENGTMKVEVSYDGYRAKILGALRNLWRGCYLGGQKWACLKQ